MPRGHSLTKPYIKTNRPIDYAKKFLFNSLLYSSNKIDQAQGRLSISLHVKFHLVYAKRPRLKNLLLCSSFIIKDQSFLVSSQSLGIYKNDYGDSIHLPRSIS